MAAYAFTPSRPPPTRGNGVAPTVPTVPETEEYLIRTHTDLTEVTTAIALETIQTTHKNAWNRADIDRAATISAGVQPRPAPLAGTPQSTVLPIGICRVRIHTPNPDALYMNQHEFIDFQGVEDCIMFRRYTDEFYTNNEEYERDEAITYNNLSDEDRDHSDALDCLFKLSELITRPKMFAIEAVVEQTPATISVDEIGSPARQSITVSIPRGFHAVVLQWDKINEIDKISELHRCPALPELLAFKVAFEKGSTIDDFVLPPLVDEHRTWFDDVITPEALVAANTPSPSAHIPTVPRFQQLRLFDTRLNVWGMPESPTLFSQLYHMKVMLLKSLLDGAAAGGSTTHLPVGHSPSNAHSTQPQSARPRFGYYSDMAREPSVRMLVCSSFLHWCIITQVQSFYVGKAPRLLPLLIDNHTNWLCRSFMDAFAVIARARPEYTCTMRLVVDLTYYTTRVELPSLEFCHAWESEGRPQIHDFVRLFGSRSSEDAAKRKQIRQTLKRL